MITSLLIAVALLMSSCAEQQCEENNTGDLQILNQTSRTLEVLLNSDSKGSVTANGALTIETLEAGSYNLFVKDVNDPTVTWSEIVEVTPCDTYDYTATF